jgi:glycosyltransferase involved in cell wall biosynthesis
MHLLAGITFEMEAADMATSPAVPVRLRVLVLAPHPFFQERGTPIAVDALVRGLVQRGHAVEILTYHEGIDRLLPGCRVTRIPRIPGVRKIPPGFSLKKVVSDLVMLVCAIGLARRRRFDVVHAVEEASFMALFMKRFLRIPYIYDMDSSLPQQLVERFGWLRPARPILDALERNAIRGSLGVVAVNRALAQLATDVAPGHMVGRLEDFSLLDPTAASRTNSERLNETVGSEGPLVVYVGNLMPYQGIDLLLEGFRLAASRHPTAQLVVIGGSEEDIRSYRGRASRLGIDDRVHLLGPRPSSELGGFLAQATLLVSPRTLGVNTPMKIYSYLDSGSAVLATRLPTHTQVLDDDIACLVVPDPTAMGEGILRLLSDPSLRESLATRARQRVREEHSREAYVRKLNDFYDRVEDRLGSLDVLGKKRQPDRIPVEAGNRDAM